MPTVLYSEPGAIRQVGTSKCAETILVVEDDEWVRRIATRVLATQGYTVLEACDGQSALSLANGFPGPIHLVLSDAIMPGMTGGVVVEQLQRMRPQIKAIFMSGYPSDAIAKRGVDTAEIVLVTKPFSTHDLLRSVREQLDVQAPVVDTELCRSLDRISDAGRLAVVRGTGLLDSPSDETFDRLTRLAAHFLATPRALISIVDEDRDFHVSAHGAAEPRAVTHELRGRTFCHYTIRASAPLVITDTRSDPVYRNVPTVKSHGVAAYVGIPLIFDGQAIGTMCAIDTVPHEWSDTDVQTLRDLAAVVLDAIELRVTTRRDAEARAALSSANLQLTLAKTSAEMANRAKAEFLTHMSHELRTPLNSIIGFTNILARNAAGTMGPRELKYVERVSFNGSHLLGLVDRLLDLSKIEHGELMLRCDWVRVEDAVRTVCDSLSEQAALAGVSLTIDTAAFVSDACGSRPIHTDESKLQQIVINLVGNAIKFTARGGEVRVALTCDGSSGEPRRIDVIDTGIGIAPEAQARVFDAFEQADGDTSARFGGTGLGLRISRALCEALGFGLTLESEVGKGSTFSIIFP